MPSEESHSRFTSEAVPDSAAHDPLVCTEISTTWVMTNNSDRHSAESI